MFKHQADCACCRTTVLPPGFDRRGFLRFAAVGAVGLAGAPRIARAQTKSNYKAMLLSCVDPRTQAPIANWMNLPAPESHTDGLKGRYSQFTIAGAAVGVVAPAFKAWRETFWSNFGASIQLHQIKNLVVVDHSNCGALGIAYGQDVVNDPKLELEAHMVDVTELKRELAIRHPDIALQAWFVARDAAGDFTKWKSLIAGPVIS